MLTAAESPIGYPIPTPQWLVSYNGVAITARIESMVVSIKYSEHLAGDAGSMELELEDRRRRWQGPWMPVRGDRVHLMIGYASEPLRDCGDFTIDEIELGGPPDSVRMRCMYAAITSPMRTANTVGWENQTLMQIATAIAAKYGLTVSGDPVGLDLTWARITQRQETDLAFLRRLANEHNYEFTVRSNTLVFYSRPALEAQAPVTLVQRPDVTKFSFKTQSETHQLYKAATVSWQDAATKKLITQTVQANPPVPVGDTLVIRDRCENAAQAVLKAQAALHAQNMYQTTTRLTVPGSVKYAAGNVVALSGWKSFDGNYLLETIEHTLAREGGYSATLEGRKVG